MSPGMVMSALACQYSHMCSVSVVSASIQTCNMTSKIEDTSACCRAEIKKRVAHTAPLSPTLWKRLAVFYSLRIMGFVQATLSLCVVLSVDNPIEGNVLLN